MGTDLGFGRLPEGMGASAIADRAAHEPGQSALSRPYGEHPLRAQIVPSLGGRGKAKTDPSPSTAYQRAVFAERERGLTHKRIARVLGTSPDGVRSTLRKMGKRGLISKCEVEWPVPRL